MDEDISRRRSLIKRPEFVSSLLFWVGFDDKTRSYSAEFPQVVDNIRQVLDQINKGTMLPNQALDEVTARSAKALGWCLWDLLINYPVVYSFVKIALRYASKHKYFSVDAD